jgi:hypothetical protein
MENQDPKKSLQEDAGVVEIIDRACKLVQDWALAKEIKLLSIQSVTPSILTSKVFSVWIFFDTDSRLKQYEEDGTVQQIQAKYLNALHEINIPAEYLNGLRFFTDTDENVQRYAALKPLDEE